MSTAKVLLKDILINQKQVTKIAEEINSVFPNFNQNKFVHECVSKLSELELKARINYIAICLTKYLPSEYPQALEIILKSLPPPCNPNLLDEDYGDFIYMAYGDFVAINGCNHKHLKISLNVLAQLTMRISMEFAIRFFINAFPVETIKEINLWSKDSHYHLRRLCSEGTRPRLPWGQNINLDYHQPLPILDSLFADNTRFVTRSVANHLNDISKINPQLVIDTITKWQKSGKQKPAEMKFIIHHSLRTLIKKGDKQALQFLGFNQEPKINFLNFVVDESVKLNSSLNFSFTITAKPEVNQNTALIIDYLIYFQNQKGEVKNHKVFKLTKINLLANESREFNKKHSVRIMSTRKLYAGEHKVAIQINGKIIAIKPFLLMF